MNRRKFLQLAGALPMASGIMSLGNSNVSSASHTLNGARSQPNILFISADDMSYDSLGCTGCRMPNISPHIDGLAREGLLLDHCHIVTPICGPSRRAWITGALPHQSGYMGHYNMPPKWFGESPIKTNIAQLLRNRAGYVTGVMCKVPDDIGWDWRKGSRETGVGRDPSKFYSFGKEFIAKAAAKGKPFFLHANCMDPHEYWARQRHETTSWIDAMMGNKDYETHANGKPYPDPDVDYQPGEVDVPPCWPDNDAIRREIRTYYNSVKRMDDVVGAILRALRDSGQEKNTLVVFVSDHGMGKAFAKWSLYPLGTRTPMIVRWPGVVAAGRHDRHNVVSALDFAPTFLEAAGLEPANYMHGHSLLPILSGDNDAEPRALAFTCFNYMNNTPDRDEKNTVFSEAIVDDNDNYRPMRAINRKRYTYIWNAWANGKREIPMEMSGGQAIRRILRATGHAVRADFERLQAPEEFYDTVADPGCLHNLIAVADQQQRITTFRRELLRVMTETGDHELRTFQRQVIK